MAKPDPFELARWQIERDEANARRFPGMFVRKLARMGVSPLAYLRGSAALFYRLLEEDAELGDGPDGEGWICGDAHIENFGAFRTEARSADGARDEGERVVFDINDLDETVIGQWRFDVLRLLTSLVLGSRELGVDGPRILVLARRLVAAHVPSAFGGGGDPIGGTPLFVRRLLPQEDKLDLSRVEPGELESVAAYLGALIGRAHHRAATKRPKAPWSVAAQEALIDRVIILVGLHEAAYLAMCKLAPPWGG